MIVVPLTSSAILLALVRGEWLTNPPNLHLYQNDYSPDVLSGPGDFVECDFPGYAAAPLAFGPPVIDGTDHSVLEADALFFKANADPGPAQRVFGLYVLDSTDTDLLFAERFSRRCYIRLKDDGVNVVCKFGALSEWTG